MEDLDKADKIFTEKVSFLTKSEKELGENVEKIQKLLYDLLVTEFLPKLQVVENIVINSANNIKLLSDIDKLFSKLDKALNRDILGKFAKDLLQAIRYNADYYEALGFQKKKITAILKNKVQMEQRLGITATGRLKKDGYLFKLGKSEIVRQQLKTYFLNGLTGDMPFMEFQLGFKNLVLGSPKGQKKGLATDGSLQKYFDQFAYDQYNNLDEVANKSMAVNLGLKHFIYEGSLIDTSRPFCIKRAGKVFTIEETKDWKDDPDLIEKRTKDAYNPLIERGRYRCRHFIKYISERLYNKFKDGDK